MAECVHAVVQGRLDLLQRLRARKPPCPWDGLTCLYAAEEGHVDILQWAHSQGCPYWEERCLAAAWTHGQWPIVQWILTNTSKKYCVSPPRTGLWYNLRVEFYAARRWLAAERGLRWGGTINQWDHTLEDLGNVLFGVVLCRDLSTLILRYC